MIMNKYTELSDFEVNKKVAEALGLLPHLFIASDVGKLIWNVPSNHNYGDIISKKGCELDFCCTVNNAWVIINAYGISLVYQDRKFQFATNDGNIECSISNPLKAAMIIFLCMKDAENEEV